MENYMEMCMWLKGFTEIQNERHNVIICGIILCSKGIMEKCEMILQIKMARYLELVKKVCAWASYTNKLTIQALFYYSFF